MAALQQQLSLVQSMEAAAEEAAAEQELELNEMRGKLALAEANRVGPLLEV